MATAPAESRAGSLPQMATKRKADHLPQDDGAAAAEPPAGAGASSAKKPKKDGGPSLTAAQSRIVGVVLHQLFKPEGLTSGPTWDDAQREQIAAQCNDELERQGEPRVYNVIKLHAWVGNVMYRHRQSLKRAEVLAKAPAPDREKKPKPETVFKKKKREAEEQALRDRALKDGIPLAQLPVEREGDEPGVLKAALIEAILAQNFGPEKQGEGPEESAESEPALQQDADGVWRSESGQPPPDSARTRLRRELENIDARTPAVGRLAAIEDHATGAATDPFA